MSRRTLSPLYVIPDKKKKVVGELQEAVKKADEVILATDEDREGESIGWHLREVLKPKQPVQRMVFHEITREAIDQALANTREIDMDLVRAQETRRILDRLVGYTVSPLLWRKIAPRLSAGRVQSVAVRLLVLRERERRAFVTGQYWDLRRCSTSGRTSPTTVSKPSCSRSATSAWLPAATLTRPRANCRRQGRTAARPASRPRHWRPAAGGPLADYRSG